jgi:hypothetical protein
MVIVNNFWGDELMILKLVWGHLRLEHHAIYYYVMYRESIVNWCNKPMISGVGEDYLERKERFKGED